MDLSTASARIPGSGWEGASAPVRPGAPDALRRRLSWVLAALVAMAGAILPAVLWPGDIGWFNDDSRLLANAYYANRAHTVAAHGLRGNFGISYGPFATQIYQVLLLATHNPITL